MIARDAAFGGVIAPTAADADAAVKAGMLARRTARRYLGISIPPFLIGAVTPADAATGSPAGGGCAFVFPWRFARRSPANSLPSHILPHELGHAIFIRFVAPRTAIDQYGGAAPDWLDEMAALAFEDDAGVRLRRADTYRHAVRGALIPLSRLLTMAHPEWDARALASGASGSAPMVQPASSETPAFYATVRAAFDFLIDRTGDPRVIRVLTARARTKAGLDRWLLAHAARGGVRRSLAGLDRDIRSFVLNDPAYRAAARSGAGPRA